MTPMQKVLRRFLAGRPPAAPKNTPLAAVALATEQRERLAKILSTEAELKNPRVTSTAVVIRYAEVSSDHLADTILVNEGHEGKALSDLEMCSSKIGREFIIAGLLFAVQEGTEKVFVGYPIDRSAEGRAAVQWSWQRQMSGVAGRAVQ